MAQYLTEQKKMLMEVLTDHCESACSIEELIAELQKKHGEDAPGKSTVYRLITHLVEEGTVKRFVKGNGRRFVYQIAGCKGCHLHLKCVDCGKLIHLDHKLSDRLIDQVALVSDFSINEETTVLFGKCGECRKEEKI